ncbi:sensor histidine kinase [Cryptosporangium sp. NPDC051539]|uniref:sensor histidine kinase n=1 Tax=Cryptosporangium sp. NPDC051539 TaxID=3363962 RepID=UPI0037BB35E5
MRRWWLGLVLGLVAAGYAVASVALRPPYADDDPRVAYALALAAGLLLAVVWRLPWPVLASEALLLVVTDTVSPFNADTAQGAILVALGFVAYRAGWPASAGGAALTLVATIVNAADAADSAHLDTLAGPPGLVRIAALITISSAPIAIGRYLRGLRDAADVARERALEAEAAREVETSAARQAERTALARDLHDILAHHIGAMALQSGAALYAVRRTGSTDGAIAALDTVRGTSVQVLNELRTLLGVLRDPDAAGIPATDPEQALGDAVSRVRSAGLIVADEIADVAGAPLVLRTTAVRVVQEGLTNSLKHAGPGARARVRVGLVAGAVHVEVSDSGPPGAPPGLPGAGHGLLGLRERVALLGGTLTAGPDGAGWRLDARLPLREAA